MPSIPMMFLGCLRRTASCRKSTDRAERNRCLDEFERSTASEEESPITMRVSDLRRSERIDNMTSISSERALLPANPLSIPDIVPDVYDFRLVLDEIETKELTTQRVCDKMALMALGHKRRGAHVLRGDKLIIPRCE
jgi:hypothetical protein